MSPTARRASVAALVALALAAGGGWAWRQRTPDTPTFRTATLERGPLVATVAASGTLAATVQVPVSSQVSGQVSEVLVDFNDTVRKGEVVARLDPESYRYRVLQAESDVDAARAQVAVAAATIAARRAEVSRARLTAAEARRDLDRKAMLVERAFISEVERDKAAALAATADEDVHAALAQLQLAESQTRNAEAQVRQRQAQLAAARVELERTVIRAPVDGVVIKRSIERGQTVAASLQAPDLFTIAQDLRDMQVEVSIDEAEVGRLREGQKATFTVDAFPGRTFEGTVRQVRKAAQNTQNVVTFTAVVTTRNEALTLVPGMTANVRVVTDARDAVLKVPNAALRFRPPGWTEVPVRADAPPAGERRRDGGGARGRVFVAGPGGKPRAVSLRLGLSDGTHTEVAQVLDGGSLDAGDAVLTGVAPAGTSAPRPPSGPRL